MNERQWRSHAGFSQKVLHDFRAADNCRIGGLNRTIDTGAIRFQGDLLESHGVDALRALADYATVLPPLPRISNDFRGRPLFSGKG
jgi:hypothetical protein